MGEYRELDLEAGRPTVDDAMKHLQRSLENYRRARVSCVLLIHGYGSSGTGGAIGRRARRWLAAQQKAGAVKAVVPGEELTMFHARALELKNKYPALRMYMETYNQGITVVEL